MRRVAWTRNFAMHLNGAPRTARWPVAHGVLLLGVLALGVALRLSCAQRPLWIDEAWVLNSVRSASLAEMFGYRDWVQTTPPGLLVLLRGVAQALPQATDELRWLFILCGIATLLLFVRLASTFSARGFLCLACATFALSPEIVWNATEFKQYGVDALVMIVSLLCGAAYIQRPTRRAYTRWCAINLVCLPLSFSAVFTLPAMLVVGVLLGDAPSWRGRLRAVLPHTLLAVVAVGVLYGVFVRPHAALASLEKFWAQGFYATSGESLRLYVRRHLSGLFGFLDIVIAPVATVAMLAGCCALGMHALWRARGTTPARALAWMALLALPVAATLAANFIGSYPLGEYRLVAFLAPCLIILLALGLEHAARALLWRCDSRTRQGWVDGLGMAAALAMTVYTAMALNFLPWGAHRDGGARLWRGNSEILPALRYLREVDSLGRPLFVHAAYQQLFTLYTRAAPLQAPVSFAETGWPCCVPGRPWRGYAPTSDEVAWEVARLIEAHGQAPFHALLYARPSWPSRDSVMLYEAAFAAHHCAIDRRYTSYRVVLMRVTCSASG